MKIRVTGNIKQISNKSLLKTIICCYCDTHQPINNQHEKQHNKLN